MSSELRTERRGGALVLTLSNPAVRNAVSSQVYAAGVEALNTAESDADVRCVVLQGEGDQFSAGSDLDRLAEQCEQPEGRSDLLDHLHSFVEALRAFPRPVIAAVEGVAAGSGFSLALACDLIVAASDARFVSNQGQVGLSPDGGATWHLSQALPRQRVLQALWLEVPLHADELHRAGLVAAIAPPGRALDEALQFADRLARGAPGVVTSVKELVQQAAGHGLSAQLQAERAHFLANLGRDDAAEGLQAFKEKRPARFT